MGYILFSGLVLYSTNGFIILVLHVFNFCFVFDHDCIFYAFLLFPCQIIALLARPIKKMCIVGKIVGRWEDDYLMLLKVTSYNYSALNSFMS